MHWPCSYKLAALVGLAVLLANSCNGRHTLDETPTPELLTAFPPSSITANTFGPKYTAAGNQCAGCTNAIGSCDYGPTLCVDTSSGDDRNLPCIELKLAMTANPEDMDTNGREVVPSWMSALTNSTNKPHTAATAVQHQRTTDPVQGKAQAVIARCPASKPTKMCCRSTTINSQQAPNSNIKGAGSQSAVPATTVATPAHTNGDAAAAACSALAVTAALVATLLLQSVL